MVVEAFGREPRKGNKQNMCLADPFLRLKAPKSDLSIVERSTLRYHMSEDKYMLSRDTQSRNQTHGRIYLA